MTGTVYTCLHVQIVPVIFEPPCIKVMHVLFYFRTQVTGIMSRKELCEKGTKNEAEIFLLLFYLLFLP